MPETYQTDKYPIPDVAGLREENPYDVALALLHDAKRVIEVLKPLNINPCRLGVVSEIIRSAMRY